MPSLFGRPMAGHVDAFGHQVYSEGLGLSLLACVHERAPDVWASRIEAAAKSAFTTELHGTAEESAADLERRIRQLVEKLGPLVGWGPVTP